MSEKRMWRKEIDKNSYMESGKWSKRTTVFGEGWEDKGIINK